MKFNHTPGPWSLSPPMGSDRIEPWFWVSADATLHLRVAACPAGYRLGENEANAKLIAAAPDLLEALIRCEANCTNDGVGRQARKAIAKAITGKTE